ncbi:MAG: SH3 domain-containing protein [Devosia sp.]
MRTLLVAAIAAFTIAPAFAEPTARISGGNVAVRNGPGTFYGIIGRIPDGTEVTLDYCTRDDRWCFVTNTGWVDASWLVGWSAKMRVTPPDFSGPGW